MSLKVLIIGGTGYIGKRLVKASLEQGHETYVFQRSDIGVNIDKVKMLLSFKKQGAHLLIGSFNDHCSLVEAMKQVDVVICAISGVHIRTHQILLQLKIIDAIKEAGNIKECDMDLDGGLNREEFEEFMKRQTADTFVYVTQGLIITLALAPTIAIATKRSTEGVPGIGKVVQKLPNSVYAGLITFAVMMIQKANE